MQRAGRFVVANAPAMHVVEPIIGNVSATGTNHAVVDAWTGTQPVDGNPGSSTQTGGRHINADIRVGLPLTAGHRHKIGQAGDIKHVPETPVFLAGGIMASGNTTTCAGDLAITIAV